MVFFFGMFVEGCFETLMIWIVCDQMDMFK